MSSDSKFSTRPSLYPPITPPSISLIAPTRVGEGSAGCSEIYGPTWKRRARSGIRMLRERFSESSCNSSVPCRFYLGNGCSCRYRWLIDVLGDSELHPKVERWLVYCSLFLQSRWGANGRRPVMTSRSGVNLLAVGRD